MVRSKRELEIILSQVPGFRNPSRYLEQYPCDSSIASDLLWLAHMNRDVEGRVVADLGCGTGILSYGALIIGAREVLCIDVDVGVLKVARGFLADRELHTFETVGADVEHLWLRGVDTVVMNPPFGVHRRGVDMAFLRRALELGPRALYTIHKYNPESHRLVYEAVRRHGYGIVGMIVKFMRIPAYYPTHRRRVHRFKVAIYAISRG